MPTHDDRVLLLNPNTGRSDCRIDGRRYRAMKRALLRVVPRRKDGIQFGELPDAVAPHLPEAVFRGASVKWYVTSVKLDLEARGVLERIPGSRPQRVRRVRATPTK